MATREGESVVPVGGGIPRCIAMPIYSRVDRGIENRVELAPCMIHDVSCTGIEYDGRFNP